VRKNHRSDFLAETKILLEDACELPVALSRMEEQMEFKVQSYRPVVESGGADHRPVIIGQRDLRGGIPAEYSKMRTPAAGK
jgi:hypothetical protein